MRILFLSHYFSPEGNAPATRVDELGRAVDDPSLAKRLGEAGRAGIAADYDYDHLAARYAELLGKIAAEARR